MLAKRSFKDPISGWSLVTRDLKSRVHRKTFEVLTKKSVNYFLRGKDIISVGPMINGVHEPICTKLIDHCARHGYGDFLIDIGANIGLTTCQNGKAFSRVVCFEPNPLCAQILKVNAEVALSKGRIDINEFGLGEKDEELELWIPKHNWGGAFVRTPDNGYSDQLLAAKDCFESIEPDNYIVKSVSIRSARDTLSKLFGSLAEDQLKSGVIKIDVEGMELAVLKGIADSIPADFSVKIVFENWDQGFSFETLQQMFTTRLADCAILQLVYSFKKSWPKIFKMAAFLFRPHQYALVSYQNSSLLTGEVMLTINPSD